MYKLIKRELELLFTALGFFTRIPIPKHISFSQENLNRCNRYFPHIGVIVGGIGALVYYGASFLLPAAVCILLSMIATIWITGAFHEDGFADVCDAFGGGWQKDQILNIMKDSRVGAYGAIGILLLLMLKFLALIHQNASLILLTIVAGHILSRSMSVWTMYALSYVREDETSKSKPITKHLRLNDFLMAQVIGIIPLFSLAVIIIFWHSSLF